jgi:hypothetical protein
MRFRSRAEIKDIEGGSRDAHRAVRYLTKAAPRRGPDLEDEQVDAAMRRTPARNRAANCSQMGSIRHVGNAGTGGFGADRHAPRGSDMRRNTLPSQVRRAGGPVLGQPND